MQLKDMDVAQLRELQAELQMQYQEWQQRGLNLNMSRGKPCKEQYSQLFQRHGSVLEQQIWQRDNTGKSREEKNDKGAFYPTLAQRTHIGIRNTRTKPAQKPNERREQIHMQPCWLDDKQHTRKRRHDTAALKQADTFL